MFRVWMRRMSVVAAAAVLAQMASAAEAAVGVSGDGCNSVQISACRRKVDGSCQAQKYFEYTHLCSVGQYYPDVSHCCCVVEDTILCCRYNQNHNLFRCKMAQDSIGETDGATLRWLLPSILVPAVLLALGVALWVFCHLRRSSHKLDGAPDVQQQEMQTLSSPNQVVTSSGDKPPVDETPETRRLIPSAPDPDDSRPAPGRDPPYREEGPTDQGPASPHPGPASPHQGPASPHQGPASPHPGPAAPRRGPQPGAADDAPSSPGDTLPTGLPAYFCAAHPNPRARHIGPRRGEASTCPNCSAPPTYDESLQHPVV